MFIYSLQLYGRLPYDDSNHKKLLKQVQNRVVFPPKPEVSEECRIFILKILVKGQDRIPLSSMKYDVWFKKIIQVEAPSCTIEESVTGQEPPTVDSGYGSGKIKCPSKERSKDSSDVKCSLQECFEEPKEPKVLTIDEKIAQLQ